MPQRGRSLMMSSVRGIENRIALISLQRHLGAVGGHHDAR